MLLDMINVCWNFLFLGKIQLFKLSEDPSLFFIVKDALWFSILIVISLESRYYRV